MTCNIHCDPTSHPTVIQDLWSIFCCPSQVEGHYLVKIWRSKTIFVTNWLKFRGCHLQWISTSKTVSLGIVDMKISWNWKNTCHIFIRAHHDEVWMISDLHYDHKANAESATALLAGMWWMEFLWNATDTIDWKQSQSWKYPPDGFNVQQTRWPKLISEWFLIL